MLPPDLVGERLVQVVAPIAPSKSALARYGTILYAGTVAGTSGDWLGIEWDDASKGRHDGEHKGRRYFQTSRAGAGSFLRAATLNDGGATFAGGRAFLDAVRERYLGEDQGSSSQAPAPLSRRNLAEIDIEAPNMDKVRSRVGQLAKLKVVSLTGPMELSEEDVRQLEEQGRVGPAKEDLIDVAKGLPGEPVDEAEAEDIGETLSSLEHLDVSRTLIPSWQRVAAIVQRLPRLRTLYLHHNRLALPTTTDFATLAASQGLQHLVELGLDRTRTSWQDALILAPYMPQVRTLQLAGNDIESLDVPETPALANLEELNLEGNRLTSFGELAALPALKRLHLSHNSIAGIPATKRRFPALEHISLTGNALFSSDAAANLWESLRNLDAAITGGLRSLSVQHQDGSSFVLSESELRLQLIARLPSLAVLNGSPITVLQRRDAELWWLTQPESSDEASKATAQRLRKAHSASEDTQPSTAPNDTPATAAKSQSKLATITLHLASHPPNSSREPAPTLKTTTFSLLPTMALRTLRPKLLRSLGLPPRSNARFYALMRSSDGDGSIVIELDDDSMPLNRYGLETGRTGDEIWVIPE